MTDPKFAAHSLTADQEQLIAYFSAGTITERRRKARNAALPRYLYKFFSFDTSVELEIKKVKDIVVNSELYLASPGSFNDPFDFRAKIELGDSAVMRKHFEKMARKQRG